MERITNVRISTLTKVVPLETDITVTSVAMSGTKMVVVDADNNTYELGTITVSNACVVQTVESHPSCGSDTSRANVIANLLRGVDGKDGKDGKTQDLSEYYKKSEVDDKLKQKQDTISNLDTIRANAEKGATAVQPSELAKVATSGNYNDLSDKPHIPAEVTEQKVRDWGFTKNTGTYSKPASGIPKTDLASDVQTSLGKAETALQSYTEQYTGTVTGVKINGSTKNPSNGVVDLGTVITEHQDIAGIEGEITASKLAQRLSWPSEDNPNPLATVRDLASKTDIIASQIFLELHTDFDDFQVFSHKRGYEEHNREVCQRLIENCFSDKRPNNEMFFVTINGMRDGVPYMETAILESQVSEVVRASFVKGNIAAQGVSIAASIGILSIEVEGLRAYAESGEDLFYWKYTSTIVPSIDAIGSEGESDVYVTEFTFEQITTKGTAVNVSPELVSAVYNKKIIVIPSKSGQNLIATNTFSAPTDFPVNLQMRIASGPYIYDVALSAKGPAPQTAQTVVTMTNLLYGTLNTINGISLAKGADMQLVSSISLNGKTYTPTFGAVDLGTIEGGSVDLSNYYTKEEVNRSVGDLEEYTNEELNKKVGKGDIIPAESIGALSNAAKGTATSNPIVGNRIPYLKADAFAFLNPDEYTIEYSVDGVDWEMADSNTIYSRSLFAGYNFYNSVPIDPSQRQFQVGSKIRITMYPKNERNAHIDVIAINMYCNGRSFDIEGEYCAKSNDTPQWQSMQRAVSSNANGVVYFQYNNKFAFEAYQRWGIRLTFTITKNTAYSSRIQGIMGYGNICSEITPSVSTAPYTLGTLWFWDYLKNITFPAAISATSLSLTGGNSANLLRGNGGQIEPTSLTLDFTQLDWYKANTQSISNGMWQVLAPYIPTTKGNRLAFLSDEEFKVEYSTNSGVTWSEMEKTSTIRNVFSGRNNGNITVKSTTTDQMRITITPNSNRYCQIDFFYFWVGSPSEGNTLMDVEFSTGNAPDTWSLHVKNVDLRGLTGANMVKYKRLFAHGSTGPANVRFTIRNTKDHNTNTTIQGISGYGTKVWGNMSNMFLTGDINSWDIDQNALFPSKIKEGDKWLDEKYALKDYVEQQLENVQKGIVSVEDPTIDVLEPNKIYVYATYTISSITINSFSTTDALTEEYVVQFRTFPTVGEIKLPSGVMWANGVTPTLEGDTLYELSIVKTHISGTDYFKAVLTPFK